MKPHIIIFNPDQWRGDVMHHLGDDAAVTPNLDALVAKDAISFRHAYCQNPVCTPSRCSFMTGWYPHTRGHRTMAYMLQPDEPMLLKTLKDEGYFVWWGGKNDVVPGQNGYADYCDVKYEPVDTDTRPLRENLHRWTEWRGDPDSDRYYTFYYGKIENETGEPYERDGDWAMVEGAVDQIKHHDSDQPLCIYLPLTYPHPPYAVEDPWYSLIDPAAIKPRTPAPENWDNKPSLLKGLYDWFKTASWTEDRWRELRRTYYGMCARVDYQLGMVVQALKDAGMYDDTAIFFFSDHGDFTGDYSLVEKTENTFEDCLTRVPFIIKPPAGTPLQPGVRDALVELVDFPATVETLLDLTPQHTHFGRSLLPLIAGETDEHRDAVFCQGGRLHGEEHIRQWQVAQDAGVAHNYYPRRMLQYSEGPEHSKGTMVRTTDYKYVQRLYENDEFYDLGVDPREENNVINDPDYAAEIMQLKDRLLRFYLETSDVVKHVPDARS